MTAIIIEDEINAYQYLVSMLQKVRPPLQILAHLDSVEDSLNWLGNHPHPDLVFLDIQLSDGLSFEIFNHLHIDASIIFTTAYDQYAIDAFKFNSIDYLLKPIHKKDLRAAIEKFEQAQFQINARLSDQIKQLFAQQTAQKKNRCLVKKGTHYEFVSVRDIAYVNSEDGITFLHTFSNQRHIYAKTVENLMSMLEEQVFFQINRGQIVNINAIQKVHPYFNQRMKIELQDRIKDMELLVSRSKVNLFKAWVDA
ncbi:MAG: LytTR family DNA-binding domain-containing protein [Bacteroidota bacterium]